MQCNTTVEGCDACAPLTGACNRCDGRRGLVGGRCVDCLDQETCVDCPGDPSRCSQCVDGYFPNADGVCELVR